MTDPLEALRDRFRLRAVRDGERIKQLWAENAASDELRGLIHDLSGAAGIFGYPSVSDAARVIDDRHAADQAPDDDQIATLLNRLAEITD